MLVYFHQLKQTQLARLSTVLYRPINLSMCAYNSTDTNALYHCTVQCTLLLHLHNLHPDLHLHPDLSLIIYISALGCKSVVMRLSILMLAGEHIGRATAKKLNISSNQIYWIESI